MDKEMKIVARMCKK